MSLSINITREELWLLRAMLRTRKAREEVTGSIWYDTTSRLTGIIEKAYQNNRKAYYGPNGHKY